MPEQQQYSDLPPGAAIVHDPTQEGQYSDLPPGAKVVTAQPKPEAQPGFWKSFGRQIEGLVGMPFSALGAPVVNPQQAADIGNTVMNAASQSNHPVNPQTGAPVVDPSGVLKGLHTAAAVTAPLGGAPLETALEQLESGQFRSAAGTAAGAALPFALAKRGITRATEAPANLPNVYEGPMPAEIPAGRPLSRSGIIHRVASTVANTGNPDVVGLVSPRLAHAQRLAGKVAAMTKSEPAAELPIQSASVSETRGPYQPLNTDLSVQPSQPALRNAPIRGGSQTVQTFRGSTPAEIEANAARLSANRAARIKVAPDEAPAEIKSSTWPPAAPRNVIQRAGRQTSKFELADRLETKEIQEQMRRDIEEHGHSAYSQEKRDWFARNQPGTPKSELTAQHPPVTSVPPVKARIVNASGESPASAEAISRVASEKAGGIKRFRIDTRSGKEVPLIGVDAVDAVAGPYDRIIQRGPKGEVTLDEGLKARPVKTMKTSEDLIEGLRSMKAKK